MIKRCSRLVVLLHLINDQVCIFFIHFIIQHGIVYQFDKSGHFIFLYLFFWRFFCFFLRLFQLLLQKTVQTVQLLFDHTVFQLLFKILLSLRISFRHMPALCCFLCFYSITILGVCILSQ